MLRTVGFLKLNALIMSSDSTKKFAFARRSLKKKSLNSYVNLSYMNDPTDDPLYNMSISGITYT